MYNIIGKLNALSPKEEPKGNLLKEIQHPAKKDVVSQLNDRYATFKQRLNESQQVDELSPKTMGGGLREAVIPKGIRSNPQKLQAYVDELKREFNNLNRFARDEGMGSYRERKRDDPDHWTTTDQDKIMDALNQAKALGVVPSKPGAGKYVSAGDQLRSDSRGTMGGGLREEGHDDYEPSPVASAVTRRILL